MGVRQRDPDGNCAVHSQQSVRNFKIIIPETPRTVVINLVHQVVEIGLGIGCRGIVEVGQDHQMCPDTGRRETSGC